MTEVQCDWSTVSKRRAAGVRPGSEQRSQRELHLGPQGFETILPVLVGSTDKAPARTTGQRRRALAFAITFQFYPLQLCLLRRDLGQLCASVPSAVKWE